MIEIFIRDEPIIIVSQMKKIISVTPLKSGHMNAPLIVDRLIADYFDVVDSTCPIADAEMVCFLNHQNRLDGAIAMQLLINQISKDGDVYLMQNTDSDQMQLGSDPNTLLLTRNLILKGWDTKELQFRYEFLNSRITHLQKQLFKLRPDLKKNKRQQILEGLVNFQPIDSFKTGQKESDAVIDQLVYYLAQKQQFSAKTINQKWMDTIKTHHDPKHKTFVLMNALHYMPDQLIRWVQSHNATLLPNQVRTFMNGEQTLTRDLTQFLKTQKIVILMPKYDRMPPLPSVNIKDIILDQMIKKLPMIEKDPAILDQSVKRLVLLKKDSDFKDNTLLHYAAIYQLTDTLKLLMETKRDIDSKGMNGNTPLQLACQLLQKQSVQLLVQAGASVLDSNSQGNTALHLAVSDHSSIASFLTQPRLLIYGQTAIREKNKKDQLAILQYLLSRNANPNQRNNGGNTPLLMALECHLDIEMIDALLNAKADPGLTNNAGQNALQIAILNHNPPDVIDSLIQHGAKVHDQGRFFLPLELAIRDKNQDTVKVLLRHGALTGLSDVIRNEFIELAVSFSTPDIVKSLLAALLPKQISAPFFKHLLALSEKNKDMHRVLINAEKLIL